jgi:hypothetical protein
MPISSSEYSRQIPNRRVGPYTSQAIMRSGGLPLQLRIREAPAADYPHWAFLWFSLAPQASIRIVSQIRSEPQSCSFSIGNSLIVAITIRCHVVWDTDSDVKQIINK